MAIKIAHTDKSPDHVDTLNPPSIEQLQEWVGGYIEITTVSTPTDDNAQLVVNKDSNLLDLPINYYASMFYSKGIDDPIVGTVVLLTNEHKLT